MRTTLLIIATAALLSGTPIIARARQATPAAAACVGVDTYGDAIVAAGAPLGAFMQQTRIAERDLASLSRAEWRAFAEAAEAVQAALEAIDPPPAVKPWHEAQIEQFGFQSTFGRTMATEGLLAAAPLVGTAAVAELTERLTSTREEALAACPTFAAVFERWDLLDGARSDATPEASPVPSHPTAWQHGLAPAW
jgi:hypothetical protein